jgi:hypothetical protein
VTKKRAINEEVLNRLKQQIKRELPAEKRDTIRVDPELDEAIDAYVDEIKRENPNAKVDRAAVWRTAAREYLGLTPKEAAGATKNAKSRTEYVPIEELVPA